MGYTTRNLKFNSIGCPRVTLIPKKDSFLETVSTKDFQYLGYKWQRMGKKYFLQLNCDNQSIVTIQNVKQNEDLDKKKIILITYCDIYPPDITVTYINKSLVLGGYFGELFTIFGRTFNVSYKMTRNKAYGAFINGSWIGMVGDLVHGRADITIGISMTRRRRDAINFSPQLFPDKYEIIFRTLNQYEWNYKFYFQPYNTQMWLCVFAMSLAVILFRVLADVCVARRRHFGSHLLSFSNDLLLSWPIVLQGNLPSFSLLSMKLVFGIYIAFSMLLLISYNSKLTSLLATRLTKVPFSSLEDMFSNTQYLPVILKGAVMEEMFPIPPYENVLRVNTILEGIELTYERKFALISQLQVIHNLIGVNCSFSVTPRSATLEFIALGYSKQFAYMDFFNFKILLLKQCGILAAEFKHYYLDERHRCLENQFNSVSFGQIIGPFLFIMRAILISLIFVIFELIIGK
uniref:Uncharacterized protein n=1 Tax=Strigamia maritima TaxID=126957 RepID=T1JHL9_STRMM